MIIPNNYRKIKDTIIFLIHLAVFCTWNIAYLLPTEDAVDILGSVRKAVSIGRSVFQYKIEQGIRHQLQQIDFSYSST
jgi:hypothetical protein